MNIKIRELKKGIFVLLTLFLFSVPLFAQLKVEGQGSDLLIKNATILTITKGTVKNGSILIQNGKIMAALLNAIHRTGCSSNRRAIERNCSYHKYCINKHGFVDMRLIIC